MAEAFQCDRPSCRRFEEGKPVMRVTFEPIAGTTGTRKWELCPACLSATMDFMEKPAVTRVDTGVRGFGRSRSSE